MIAGLKNNCIFELSSPKTFLRSNKGGFFYAQKSFSDLNIGYQIPVDYPSLLESVIVFGETGGDSLSYLINFLLQMPKTEKITRKPNNSKLKSTYVARNAKPKLILSGVKNPYLFCLRKIFQDFLEEEKQGNCFSEERLIKKIEAARLMFPEAQKSLINLLKN